MHFLHLFLALLLHFVCHREAVEVVPLIKVFPRGVTGIADVGMLRGKLTLLQFLSHACVDAAAAIFNCDSRVSDDTFRVAYLVNQRVLLQKLSLTHKALMTDIQTLLI